MSLLFAGTIQNLYTTNNTKVFNICSLNESYPRLRVLPPIDLRRIPSQNPEMSEYEFDIRYAQWILSDNNAFFDLMQIVYSLYQGYDVFLLISNIDPSLDAYAQSLFKLIQQRYGINVAIINDIEDLFNAEDVQITGLGAANLMDDKERLSFMLEESRQAAGGAIPNEF